MPGGVHLVDSDDELLDSQGVSQQGVLSGLTILGDASLELASAGSDDQYTTISLELRSFRNQKFFRPNIL